MDARRITALYLQPAPLFGGGERQAAFTASLLPRHGVDVLPVVGPGRAIADWLTERGIGEFVFSRGFPGGWPKQVGLRRVTLGYRYPRCARQLGAELDDLLDARPIDVIYASLPFSWIVATPVARRRRIPIVWRAGGIEVNPAQAALLRAFTRACRPDLLVCPAEVVRLRFEPLVRAPVEIVQNGVDAAQFYPGAGDASRYRPEGARFVVGFAARLVPQKRPEDFIHLAARLGRERRDLAFLVAGEGSRRPLYEAMGREAGARGLRFFGYVPDMPSFYAACDVVVLPSRSEGCPNVVLEAMAMRRVVLVSAAAARGGLVRHGVDGLVVETGDLDGLVGALRSLLDHPARAERLAAAAHARVTTELTADASAARIATLLRDVARSARRAPPAPARAPRPGAGGSTRA